MNDIVYVLEFIGIMAFSISGMIAAKAKNMDPVGIYVIACITAFGGGTVRDILLDRISIYWIQHQEFPIIILMLSLLISYVKWFAKIKESYLLIPDAIGLGVFSILGAELSLEHNVPIFIASLLGVLTGTFGGAMRDTLCNELPSIFTKAPLYASCSFAGCWIYFLAKYLTQSPLISLLLGLISVVFLRYIAIKYNIRLHKT